MALNPTEPKWSLRLPADCSIAAIRNVYELIREAFGRQERLEIDCSSVDKADVTSIQLLLSTAKTGEAQAARWCSPPSPSLCATPFAAPALPATR